MTELVPRREVQTGTAGQPWWMTARIYQVLPYAFKDADGDGWGDLSGLTSRLDYVRLAGFNAIWLPPIFKSPRRDQWYDVSDYYEFDRQFGSVDDFRRLCAEADRRGIRIIVDLPFNHTSEDHPWFQASRDPDHPEHAKYRDWYLWSDNPREWDGASIIFRDHEVSNAEYDRKRGQYFCHRFYRHMPDLNLDHPAVREEFRNVLRFLFGLGVHLVRVDAVPHMIKRPERGSFESDPDVFTMFEEISAWVRENFPGRGLLAEACQPPELLVKYLQAGFVAAFDFISMPATFEALARGRAEPLERLVKRLSQVELPDGTTLVGFLGLHDEKTWEMVPRATRHFLWDAWGEGDARRKQNWGTVGRLMSLVDGDRRRWQLLLATLYALPGAKLVMYGDELGVGDTMDVPTLPEEPPGRPDYRRATRTVMPWTGGRGADFSAADPEAFYAPLVDDPTLGYAAVNVEAQRGRPDSELHFMIGLNGLAAEYGDLLCTGTLVPLSSGDPGVAVWARTAPGRIGEDVLLPVFNLTDTEHHVRLDLGRWAGRLVTAVHPTILGGAPSSPRRIEEGKPFELSLPPYGFGYYLVDLEH